MSLVAASVWSTALLLSFALLCTLHVTIAFSLAQVRPRWRALLALVVPLAAPVLAFRSGKRGRALFYVVLMLVYALARSAGPT